MENPKPALRSLSRVETFFLPRRGLLRVFDRLIAAETIANVWCRLDTQLCGEMGAERGVRKQWSLKWGHASLGPVTHRPGCDAVQGTRVWPALVTRCRLPPVLVCVVRGY